VSNQNQGYIKNTLNVLFLWHMHQPSYRIDNEPFLLPWTRLHATKDYLGMAKLFAETSNVKVTFNFTPVLWEQLLVYSAGGTDRELQAAQKNTEELSRDEVRLILTKMFLGNPNSLIFPYPRYKQLYHSIGPGSNLVNIDDRIDRTSPQELRDLIVWRVLAWIDPDVRGQDAELSALESKGENFTREEKQKVIEKSLDLIKCIPDQYRASIKQDKAELTTTPYYHPILPLLINTKSALEAIPGIRLPGQFSFDQDAGWQIEAAQAMHTELFDRNPTGFWPAEGSVSNDAAELFAKHNVKWIATDENILEASSSVAFSRNSNGHVNRPDLLYRPWSLDTEQGRVAIFFRDHLLSDLLGFEYQHWDVQRAVEDFNSRLTTIHEATKGKGYTPCVAVILDGENAWEHYSDGGFPFLRELFSVLSTNKSLNLRSFSDYLADSKDEMKPIERLRAGSWINGNFGIWIGNPEENSAWKLLHETHLTLEARKSDISEDLYQELRGFIRKAQASDSFWWYGDDHHTEEKSEFDFLFRSILMKVYQGLNLKIPDSLSSSLLTESPRQFKLIRPKMLISPSIDGKIGRYYDWYGAGTVEFRGGYSSMHASQKIVFKAMKYGFDLNCIYLMLTPGPGFSEGLREGLIVSIDFVKPDPSIGISFSLQKDSTEVRFSEDTLRICREKRDLRGLEAAYNDILEIAAPFHLINARKNEPIDFHVEIKVGGRFAGRIPDQYGIEFDMPTEDYHNHMWEV